jgi:hypothetical protein
MSNNPVPFYTQAALLDQYIHSENPGIDPDVVQLILNILRTKEQLRDYFFRSVPSSAWAKILWENGFLSIPPALVKTQDGYSLKSWDVQYYLIAVAPQVPEIVLNHVQILEGHAWYLAKAIEATSKIPVQHAEKALPRILNWLSSPEISETAQAEVILLIEMMIKNEKFTDALMLFDALSAKRDENKSHNNMRSYKILFGFGYNKSNVLEVLKNYCPLDLVNILEKRLFESVYDNHSASKKSLWWRNAIEDSEQNIFEEYQDYILDALRDTIALLIESHIEKSKEIIIRYLKENHDIFRRLGLYLIGLHPDKFKLVIIIELLNSNNLNNVEIHHEFFMLLEKSFPLLENSDKQSLVEMVLNGPNLERIEKIYDTSWKSEYPDREKFVENWKNTWIRDRLWMIRENLNEQTQSILTDLVERVGPPKYPAYLSWVSSGWQNIVQESPYSIQELEGYSPSELLSLIKNWNPEHLNSTNLHPISHDGLANEVAKLIGFYPEKYAECIVDICLTRPEYPAAITSTWIMWIKSEPDKTLPLELILGLFSSLLKYDQVWNDEIQKSYDGESWRNVRLSIVRMLEILVTNDKEIVPNEFLGKVQALLFQLIDDADPSLNEDRPLDGWVGHNDPITVALNHVRPIALKALIHCTLQIATQQKLNKTKQRRMPREVADKLDQKLLESSRAMRSVFGEFIPILYWLDQNWLTNHLDSIFPVGRDNESTWLFMSAWDAYVLNKYNQDVFEKMQSKYFFAIEYLSQGYQTKSDLGQASNLSAHLLFNYLFSELSLEYFNQPGSLLLEFFQKTQPEIRRLAAWALWRICESNPNNLSEFWPKAKELWYWRSKEAIVSAHSPDFNAEITEFAQLLQVAPEFETMKSMHYLLDGLLPHFRQVEIHDIGWSSVETFLANKVDKEPVDVIKFYRLMCEQKFNPPQWIYFSENAKKIILTAADNTKSRVDALALIDFFAQTWRDFDTFKPIYQKYAGI